MRITSSDVEAVKFPVTIRGYAEDEVDNFLDLVIETMGDYEKREAEAKTEIDRLRAALEECMAARLEEAETSRSLKEQVTDVRARMQDVVEEATRTSERVVGEALKAGEHLLEQVRSAILLALDQPRHEPSGPPTSEEESAEATSPGHLIDQIRSKMSSALERSQQKPSDAPTPEDG